ncbi:MAG: hypothetical protein AAGJ82_07660 [Bacteroidota bacterium]
MSHIAIPIPVGRGKQDIQVQVSINGQRQDLHYKVELFYWDDCTVSPENRVACIREMLNRYDEDWALYYIGDPNEEFIPVTFVRKDSRSAQQYLWAV